MSKSDTLRQIATILETANEQSLPKPSIGYGKMLEASLLEFSNTNHDSKTKIELRNALKRLISASYEIKESPSSPFEFKLGKLSEFHPYILWMFCVDIRGRDNLSKLEEYLKKSKEWFKNASSEKIEIDNVKYSDIKIEIGNLVNKATVKNSPDPMRVAEEFRFGHELMPLITSPSVHQDRSIEFYKLIYKAGEDDQRFNFLRKAKEKEGKGAMFQCLRTTLADFDFSNYVELCRILFTQYTSSEVERVSQDEFGGLEREKESRTIPNITYLVGCYFVLFTELFSLFQYLLSSDTEDELYKKYMQKLFQEELDEKYPMSSESDMIKVFLFIYNHSPGDLEGEELEKGFFKMASLMLMLRDIAKILEAIPSTNYLPLRLRTSEEGAPSGVIVKQFWRDIQGLIAPGSLDETDQRDVSKDPIERMKTPLSVFKKSSIIDVIAPLEEQFSQIMIVLFGSSTHDKLLNFVAWAMFSSVKLDPQLNAETYLRAAEKYYNNMN